MTAPTKQPISQVQMAAERPVFDIFVVNFIIGPSLRGLHWLEGG